MNASSILIRLSEIDPTILRSARNVLEPGYTTHKRIIAHYQLQYIQEGTGEIIINNEVFKVHKGMLCFWGPGVTHQITSDEDHPLIILGAQFHLHPSMQQVQFDDFIGYSSAIVVQAQGRVESLLLEVANECKQQRRYWDQTAGSLLKVVLLILARQTDLSDTEHELEASWKTVDHILTYIQSNYMKSLTNAVIAKHFHYHPSYLNKLVMGATGQSLHQYILNLRINQAVEKLYSTNMSITEIAESVGYANVQYFSRIFKKKMGTSPKKLRQ